MKTTPPAIAIVGMACIYPDARNPAELWENVLAQRRAFRRMPPERLRLEDYWSDDPAAPDRSYASEAAVIEGYQFDRVGFRVVGSTFRSADLAHWLALDVAARALADAGFPDARGLARESTGVMLGNTLTGEFSRASNLRLRWPYVRRMVEAGLERENWPANSRRSFLEKLEADYKQPFAPVGEETLAGGLSNTIAGRICNQFDFKGGGYTVDGACASSLLAVANACSALAAGDLDAALAGGVDLSLDPFELVGFAKTGALAPDEMRVFDRRSAGFLPGEGCGFAVLMRHADAVAQRCRVYAVIRGWGISSDGSGGITRPEAQGQVEALRRAYRRAGFGFDRVTYCEGHGTGTAVGDTTELEVLARARRETKADAPPAVVGSIKANIGHTKAAAGIAGLIKATMAVHCQVLPPTTGCEQPQEQLAGQCPALRVLDEAELWPKDRPLCASVSAMGFGGINAHIVLENEAAQRRHTLSARERSLSRSHQDAELFLLTGQTAGDLDAQAEKIEGLAGRVSRAEFSDLAARLQETQSPGPFRAAIVAAKPAELVGRLATLRSWLQTGVTARLQLSDGVFLGSGQTRPRIGFLFPGQGSPTHSDGGIWRQRFESVRELYARAALPAAVDSVSTRVMQPAVVTASLAGIKVLEEFGLEANAAVGHSLGEITALHWAGSLNEEALLRIARERGAAMAELGSPTGAMLAIAAPATKVRPMLKGKPLSIVGFNSPGQTVVAGESSAIAQLESLARASGCQATLLPVSHAFHTKLVAAAVPVLQTRLAAEEFGPVQRTVVSTITGRVLESHADLRSLLCRQVVSPVRFASSLSQLLGANASTGGKRRANGILSTPLSSNRAGAHASAAILHGGVDLLIEVGPGAVLSNLVRETTDVPVVALDSGGSSLTGLLHALGSAFALGAPVQLSALFEGRFTRRFSLNWKPKFFANPCEQAPVGREEAGAAIGVRPSPGAATKVLPGEFEDPKNGTYANIAAPGDGRTPNGSGNGKSNGKNGKHGTNGKSHAVQQMPCLPDTCHSPPLTSRPTPVEVIRRLVAERAELPPAAVQDHHRMLSDLHLNSITVGQLVSEAARVLGLPRVIGLTDFANATVVEIAGALGDIKAAGTTPGTSFRRRLPPGVDIWAETFTVEMVEVPGATRFVDCTRPRTRDRNSHWDLELAALETGQQESEGNGEPGSQPSRSPAGWEVFARVTHSIAGPLRAKLMEAGGGGVLVCLPENPTEDDLSLLVAAGRAVTAIKSQARFVLVQHAWGGGGFARTLHQETPGLTTCVVDVPPNDSRAIEWIAAEVASASGYTEAHYDTKGIRREPRMKLLENAPSTAGAKPRKARRATGRAERFLAEWPIGSNDVLLVTGGGKGIAAECALAIGRETDAQLVLVGRSDSATDQEISNNLERMRAAGVRANYVQADVTDANAVRAAVAEAEKNAGPITAILHAAGVNRPQLIGGLDEADFRRTIAPKVQGLRNVLAALDADRLRLLLTFGSIIARAGLRGEADYATANEWLRALTEKFQNEHPRCRCLALEWSVWSGVGMGERLGRVEALVQQGIMPIPPERGAATLLQALRESGPVSRIITGRFGQPPTLTLDEAELPLHRFLERKRVFYPGVELVVDAELSIASDPYLNDHIVQRQRLLPAVVGLEAMAQTAMAVVGSSAPPAFENVALSRPVTVSEKSPTTIRVAALRRGPGVVDVCLRSEETDYQVDHFRAICRFGATVPSIRCDMADRSERREQPLDPQKDLYGRVLFHQGRFCRISNYQRLSARECVAEISESEAELWFGPYLPVEFVLGDPAARDAALHAIQACIPHQRILPTGIDRLQVGQACPRGSRFVHARERLRKGNDFTYDVEIRNRAGELVEIWEGLHLRAVEPLTPPETWPVPLLAPYLERRIEELSNGRAVSVAFDRGPSRAKTKRVQPVERLERSDRAIVRALGVSTRVWRRGDGKPLVANGQSVSAAHAEGFTLAVAGDGRVACDLEALVSRTESAWRDLLGPERFKVASRVSSGQGLDSAATRLWNAFECLKKAGLPADAPLVLDSASADGWVIVRSGSLAIATCILSVRGSKVPLSIAVAFDTISTSSTRYTAEAVT